MGKRQRWDQLSLLMVQQHLSVGIGEDIGSSRDTEYSLLASMGLGGSLVALGMLV